MKRNNKRIGLKRTPKKPGCSPHGRNALSEPTEYQRKMKKRFLRRMIDEHPEWMQKLKENGALEHFIDSHINRISARFGYGDLSSEAESTTDPRMLLSNMARYLSSDPLLQNQRRMNCPRYEDDSESEGADVETAGVIQETAESAVNTGKTYYPAEGFSVEWDKDGLRVGTIDYHATELLIEWDKLAEMVESAVGGSANHRLEHEHADIDRESAEESNGTNAASGSGIQGSGIIRAFAEDVCQRVTRTTIAHLQSFTDHRVANGSSGMQNTWEAMCVETQLGRSDLWRKYHRRVRSFMAEYVSELRPFERDAIWLQTNEGQRWIRDPEHRRRPYPVAGRHIVNYIASYLSNWEAYHWTNRRIRTFVKRHIQG